MCFLDVLEISFFPFCDIMPEWCVFIMYAWKNLYRSCVQSMTVNSLLLYCIFIQSYCNYTQFFVQKVCRIRIIYSSEKNIGSEIEPSTSFCECLYTINKLNNILSFYIGNETNFFYLFMKGVFFEIFYDIVKLNMVFIPTKPILFVCIKLCIHVCIYCCWYIKVLYTPPVLHMIFFVISDK